MPRVSRVWALAVGLAAAPPALAAQATVTGLVFDSIAGRPLAGATIQLFQRNRLWEPPIEALSDPDGRFRIEGAPAGRYVLGVQHPRLDALGLDGLTRAIDVSSQPVRADLGVPGARRVVDALCGSADEGTRAVFGFARDGERGTPATGGAVVVQWGELAFGGGLRTVSRSRTAEIDPEGSFLVCGVPTDVPLSMRATMDDEGSAGRRASGRIEVRFAPGVPVLRRDLLLGEAGRRRGTARLSGTVRDGAGRAVAGAIVEVRGAEAADSAAMTDAEGRFALSGLPPGTFPVVARALGMAAGESAADLRPDETATLALRLTETAFPLAPVDVHADVPEASGFATRMRRGLGRFVTREEIVRSGSQSVAQALLMVPTVRVQVVPRTQAAGGEATPTPMAVTGRGGCTMAFFVDGMPVAPGDVDLTMPTSQIGGIEVYADQMGAPGPATFGGAGCGVVMIWSRRAVP